MKTVTVIGSILYGVRIDTVDNPGWSVEIDLTDTYLEDVPFDSIEEERMKKIGSTVS